MAVKIKKGQPSWIAVDTEFDVFDDADSFSAEIVAADTGSQYENKYPSPTFEEIMWTNPGHSCTLTNDALEGDAYFTVDPSSCTVVPGDRIKDSTNNIIYYVTDVSQAKDKVYVKGGVKANLSANTELDTVGNTGIYRYPIQIDDLGDYFVNFHHPDMGHATVKVEVVEHDDDDIYQRLDEGLNSLGATRVMKVIA